VEGDEVVADEIRVTELEDDRTDVGCPGHTHDVGRRTRAMAATATRVVPAPVGRTMTPRRPATSHAPSARRLPSRPSSRNESTTSLGQECGRAVTMIPRSKRSRIMLRLRLLRARAVPRAARAGLTGPPENV
jgi:hypothetical protein